MHKRSDSINLDCEKELTQRDQLYQKRMKLEAGVRHFENNNEEYTKIRKTVEEKVDSVMSDKKMVMKLALLSLTESMRKHPDKYSLIYCNTSHSPTPAIDYGNQYEQQQYQSQGYADMLLEEAQKLYNKLAKGIGYEIITDYVSNIPSSLLPLLPSPEERESNPTKAANLTHMHIEEHRLFTQSEIYDDD